MRNRLGLAAPKKPPGFAHVKYLYRGIQMTGPFAPAKIRDSLRRHGGIADKGYMALSTDQSVAVSFATKAFPHGALLLRLPISSIPKGTPYIWFGKANARRRVTQSYAVQEKEVLLPPGILKVPTAVAMVHGLMSSKQQNNNKNKKIITIDVTYVPDRSTKAQGVRVFGKPQSGSRALERSLAASRKIITKAPPRKRKQSAPKRYANPNNSNTIQRGYARLNSNYDRKYLKETNLRTYPIIRAILEGVTNPYILKTAYKVNPFPNAHMLNLVDLVISYGVPRQLTPVLALQKYRKINSYQLEQVLKRQNWKEWVDAFLHNRKWFIFNIDRWLSHLCYFHLATGIPGGITLHQVKYFIKKRAISPKQVRTLIVIELMHNQPENRPVEAFTKMKPLLNFLNSLTARRITRSMAAKRAEY